ncbi:MAG: 6-phosphogluconolactonase [Phycisphaerae bacterium]|jgi:6-phosphogluconolactonase|nr:6-phosphogluconolactonase [Phycisphaerae bacterium]MDP7287241.1 6-phosphogluconolactonase [Phycisphaerae bacterium]
MSELQYPARVVVHQSAQGATEYVADLVRQIICDAVTERGSCKIALAGGTTPHALYKQLAREGVSSEVPWRDVDVFFGDERNVPHDHVESNFRMAQRALLDHVTVNPERVNPMPADSDELDSAAEKYEQLIRQRVEAASDGIPCFDLILLGMGGDGHTASLFPFTKALSETERLVLSHFVPVLGRRRMTFTFPLINAARNIVALVTGTDKAEAISIVMGNDEEARADLPFSKIRPTSGEFCLAMDANASRLLDQSI